VKLTTLTQDGRDVEGLRSFGPEEPPFGPSLLEEQRVTGMREQPLRVRVGLSRYSIAFSERVSCFVLNRPGIVVIRFNGYLDHYDFHPATGLFAVVHVDGEPEIEWAPSPADLGSK
jgi:hypothetical protein